MQTEWTNRWNERYQQEAFAYGTQPNRFLEEQLLPIPPGAILLPAEGEGRNAVFAAKLGWDVSAFDISEEGRKKAEKLAVKNEVELDYSVGGLDQQNYKPAQFDVVALIYAHFPAAIKSTYHRELATYVKPGGYLIFEAFSKAHLSYVTADPAVGGPKDIESLFSLEEIQTDFRDFDFQLLNEVVIDLSEGLYHNGKGAVIRFVAQKLL